MNISIIIPFFIGCASGWLINYIADVFPVTRRFSQPACIHCKTDFSTKDYLSFRKCRSCGKQRKLRNWIVLLLAVTASFLLWIYPHNKLGYGFGLALLVYFAVVFVIDLEHRLIMHPISIPGIVMGIGVGTVLHGFEASLIGGVGGFAIMMVIYWFGTLFARIRARKMQAAGLEPDDEEALGAGDVILATMLGFMLGWPLIWFGLLLGILLGGVITLPMLIILLVVRRYKQDAWMTFIPYGPFFLISAALIIYLPNLLSVLVPK